MMKKILAFILVTVMVAMMSACGTEEKSIVDKIAIDKYKWGTTSDTVSKGEIKKGMKEEKDYAFVDGSAEFYQELIIDTKIDGKEFRKYYDFDMDNGLVSVMVALNAVLTHEETAQIYLDLVEAYQKEYGQPYEIHNEFSEMIHEDLEGYANALASGEIISSYTWFDEEGNQLMIYAALGVEYIDVIIVYSAEEYVL